MNKWIGMMAMFFVVAGLIGFSAANAPTVNPNVTIGNSNPVVWNVSALAPVDPNSVNLCSSAATANLSFTAHDDNGVGDINTSGIFVQLISQVNISHTSQITNCVVTEAINSTDQRYTCNAANMNYYDDSGSWTVQIQVPDASGFFGQNNATTMTYNTATLANTTQTLIEYGNIFAGTTGNPHINGPFALQNCGNVPLNQTITGANLTDGGSNVYGVGNFSISGNSSYAGPQKMFLTQSAQPYQKAGGIAIAAFPFDAGAQFNLFFYANAPTGMPKVTYNTGTWTFTVSSYN